MTSELVERLRGGRHSGAVLKAKLSQIRARNRTVAVFVYEGVDDVGPYSVWISRLDSSLSYEPLPGTGKRQVLDLRIRLQEDKAGLRSGVYFFVDRDFDDLRGQAPGPDIYCTTSYSVENYLVSERVLAALLTDEFRCTADTDDRDNVLKLFREVLGQFSTAMCEPNRRLFRGSRLNIRSGRASNTIGKYVQISLASIAVAYTEQSLSLLIPLDREPTTAECVDVDQEFERLSPLSRHRGKYFIAFFLRWLELLASERKNGNAGLFSSTLDVKFSAHKLSLKALALHGQIPEGLAEFISNVRQGAAPLAAT